MLKLRLVGPMQANMADGRPALPRGRKPRAVIAVLALSSGHAMPRVLLASLLWSTAPAKQALARLREALSELRGFFATLGADVLAIDAETVALRPDRISLDMRMPADASALSYLDTQLLPDLRGIDPQLDDWLMQAQAQWLKARVPASPIRPALRPERSPASVRPSLLVQPVNNLAGEPGEVPGVATNDHLLTCLSALRSVDVLAPVPGFPTRSADFVLSGNLHAGEQGLTASLHLMDVNDGGRVLWSERLEGKRSGTLAFSEEVAAKASARIEHELLLAESRRAAQQPIDSVDARVLTGRAVANMFSLDRERFMQAGGLLQQATRLESNLASAHAWLAYWHILLVGQGWAVNEKQALQQAGLAAEQAIILDPKDARGLAIAGHVRGFLYKSLPEAMALHDRALSINPSLPLAWTLSGIAAAYAGDLADAKRRADRSLQLLPYNSNDFFTSTLMTTVELLTGRHESAVQLGRMALQAQPRFTATLKVQLAALGHLGREAEARPILRRLLQLEPNFSLRRFRGLAAYVRREHIEHYARGLKLGGLS